MREPGCEPVEVLRRRPAVLPAQDEAQGASLDVAAEGVIAGLRSLSDVSAPLALAYLERIGRPLKQLSLDAGARVTSAGYAAHLAVEADGAPFGVDTVPVLGTLPPLRDGKPPGDLLLRVVKATRRPFPAIRAVDDATWEGFVTCRSERLGIGLDRGVVDGLLRFGWVLRQVDLAYGSEPERV